MKVVIQIEKTKDESFEDVQKIQAKLAAFVNKELDIKCRYITTLLPD